MTNLIYWPTSKNYKNGANQFTREVVEPFFKKNNINTILDFGCGTWFRDSLYLTEKGFQVYCVELEEQIERMKLKNTLESALKNGIKSVTQEIPDITFDSALIHYVIDVTETQEKRKQIINKVSSQVKDNGYISLSVISETAVKQLKTGEKFNDGFKFLHSKQDNTYTFLKDYRKYNDEKEKNGFIPTIEDCGLEVVIESNQPYAFFAIAQKS